jgi:MerR family redox-sensitive transcriptional activator SoxR
VSSLLFQAGLKSGRYEKEAWTIRAVARAAGVATSILRYYQSVGLLQPARRVKGQRGYHPDAARRMAVYQLAQQAGVTIAEMRSLAHSREPETPSS